MRTAPRDLWYGKFLDAESSIHDLVRAIRPVAEEINQKYDGELDGSWNPDHHLELTLSVSECRLILELVKKHTEPKDGDPDHQ